jgi:hypothetical protein
MTKPVGIAIMLFIIFLTFAGHTVAPSWFINSQAGDWIFTILLILEIVGLIYMVK